VSRITGFECFETLGISKAFTNRYRLARMTEEHVADELAIGFEIPLGA
jgi:hypothetical protein